MAFIDILKQRWAEKKFVAISLDPDPSKIPDSVKTDSIEETFFNFNKAIIDATHDLVCAYKPQSAFYEAEGAEGIAALKKTISYIKKTYPDIPVILDGKRGDTENTNVAYAKAAFETLSADAVTVNPYLGGEALEPFLKHADKGIFILVKTSNPGSAEFQDLTVFGMPLYQKVAEEIVATWNRAGNCGVVVGATYPEDLKRVRDIIGEMPILLPGIGAQGGNVKESINAGKNKNNEGIIVVVGRSVLYASTGSDFAEASKKETLKISEEIKSYL